MNSLKLGVLLIYWLLAQVAVADDFEIYIDEGGDSTMEVLELPKNPKGRPVIKKIKVSHRKPSASGSMVTLKMDCPMHSLQDSSSDIVLTIKEGKSVWLEIFSSGWRKGYHRNGHGFLSPHCFQ